MASTRIRLTRRGNGEYAVLRRAVHTGKADLRAFLNQEVATAVHDRRFTTAVKNFAACAQ